ncbi:MAG: cytidyltransferase-like protein [Limisphaerales bacterium]|nr:MAG: cytidyltransferase-like protein [Limisphaerales bacterium]KAG0510397.1 MAG: cytidyltransferase-like protein [Limisphaerales bacterium]TXT51584.1 MAG: cytidyltransferase-like protein [Limisphaerales bacterium]
MTREQLREAIGPRPRPHSVIMCHGTFDLVHPGHIRHLMYAKSKADKLIASLTSDAHINKANFRPFVPQELRAMNLAALECVDYVIVDENATPIENLQFIQPDFFAKGYEYSSEGVHPKTKEEIATLESYGGEVVFTPGDLIMSSSAIIDLTPPNLAVDKLHALLESEGLGFADLRTALDKMRGVRVHVIGDTIVDGYTYCTLIGGTAKTPTFSVKYERAVDFSGGAAVVAKHMRAAGGEVVFSTMLGNDALKDFVVDDLKSAGITVEAVVDPTRPTTHKNAFITNGYRMLKVDKLDNRPISDKILEKLKAQLAAHPVHVAVFSDFRHGLFNKHTIPPLTAAVPAGVMRVADSQVANRWGNILEFQDFDLITPNEREARFALGDQDSTVRPLALDLYKKARCKTLILKLGERGLITYRSPDPNVRSFFTVDSFAGNVVDAVGAGDALLAYATLSLKVTGSNVVASILGSIAAAVACEHDGNNPVAPDAVLKKLAEVEKRARFE